MTCFSAKRLSTAYLDGRLRSSEHTRLTAHLRDCDSCASHYQQISSVRGALQSIQPPPMPTDLKVRLAVLATQECAAVLETRGNRLQWLWNRWRFRMDEFMRPLTIPATGGLLSSVALFATLALGVCQTARSVGYEVPVFLEERTDATLVPVDMKSSVVLTMRLNAVGRIMDYAVRDASASYTGNPKTLTYNNIALPEFPTVLTEANAVTGNVRISMNPIIFRQ